MAQILLYIHLSFFSIWLKWLISKNKTWILIMNQHQIKLSTNELQVFFLVDVTFPVLIFIIYTIAFY